MFALEQSKTFSNVPTLDCEWVLKMFAYHDTFETAEFTQSHGDVSKDDKVTDDDSQYVCLTTLY